MYEFKNLGLFRYRNQAWARLFQALTTQTESAGFDLKPQREKRREDDLTLFEKFRVLFWFVAAVFLTFAIWGTVTLYSMPLADIQ